MADGTLTPTNSFTGTLTGSAGGGGGGGGGRGGDGRDGEKGESEEIVRRGERD